MGIYTLCVNNGPHIAPIIGGYIALNLSWRWCFYVPGIIQAGLWVVLIFTFPETLFSREDFSNLDGTSYWSKLGFKGKILNRATIRPRDFLTPYRMIQYWAVTLPSIYWMTANTYGSALFAVTGSHLAAKLYKFNVAQTGLLMGLPLTIGCMLGEACAGWLSDTIINTYARRHGGYRKPEIRLALLPGTLAVVAGVIAYGPSVQAHKPWIVLAVCMGVAGFGLQLGATMVYTYTTDCYKAQSAEIGAVINLFKSGESSSAFFTHPGSSPIIPSMYRSSQLTIGIYSVRLQHCLLCSTLWRGRWLQRLLSDPGHDQRHHAPAYHLSLLQRREDQGTPGRAQDPRGSLSRLLILYTFQSRI